MLPLIATTVVSIFADRPAAPGGARSARPARGSPGPHQLARENANQPECSEAGGGRARQRRLHQQHVSPSRRPVRSSCRRRQRCHVCRRGSQRRNSRLRASGRCRGGAKVRGLASTCRRRGHLDLAGEGHSVLSPALWPLTFETQPQSALRQADGNPNLLLPAPVSATVRRSTGRSDDDRGPSGVRCANCLSRPPPSRSGAC